VFDNTDVANEGKFLGLFRVQSIKKGGEQFQLTVIPASFPTLPSDSDIRLWTRDYDHVTVYESLPVDRWLAFYKTPKEPGEDAAGGDSAPDGRWRPQPRKIADKELLENLEGQMEGLQQHGETVPADKWPQLGKQLADREIMPGRYWATVEFTKNVRFTKKDAFTLDESSPEQAASGGAEDEGTPAEAGGAGADSGIIGPTDADPTAAANSKLFTKKDFKEGDTAEFDLQTALELQNDKQFVRITSVVKRRPLADPLTAIRGTEFGAVDGYPVRAEGIDAIRQALLVEKAAIIAAMDGVASSRANVQAQTDALAEEETELNSDLEQWRQDEATATATAKAFDDRFRAATIELAAMETLIVRLGKELSDTWAVLTETIEATTR